MIITQDREELDKALQDPFATVLILAGGTGSQCREVHDFVDSRTWEQWYRWFLITDLSVLSNEERMSWFGGDVLEQYAVLGGKLSPKNVAQQGAINNLLNKDGSPSYLRMRRAFLAGDRL